jgi:hypothetical protein
LHYVHSHKSEFFLKFCALDISYCTQLPSLSSIDELVCEKGTLKVYRANRDYSEFLSDFGCLIVTS